MRKLQLIGSLLLVVFIGLHAQVTPKAEYYFNIDPGVGKGTSVTVTNNNGEYSFTGDISTAGLSLGFHRLYFRFLDANNRWGITENNLLFIYPTVLDRPFVLQPRVTAFEYYYDTDPGVGNGVKLPVTATTDSVSLVSDIPTKDLAVGFHRLYIRATDGAGKWSVTENKLLYVYNNAAPESPAIKPAPIVALEYFIDKDPGIGKGKSFAVFAKADTVTVTADISTANLPEGSHTVYIRAKDLLGNWSIYDSKVFSVALNADIKSLLGIDFNAYPNPTKGEIRITLPDNLGENVKLELVRSDGTVLNLWKQNSLEQNITFNLSTYPKGIYLIRLSNGLISGTKKFVLQ